MFTPKLQKIRKSKMPLSGNSEGSQQNSQTCPTAQDHHNILTGFMSD